MLCSRITGTSATGPNRADSPRDLFWNRKRLAVDPRRDGRWDVLCENTASFVVNDQPSCVTCLPAVVERELAAAGEDDRVLVGLAKL